MHPYPIEGFPSNGTKGVMKSIMVSKALMQQTKQTNNLPS
jgi:hypothetical protein